MIENVDRVLSRLGEQMELQDVSPVHIVVCGGAALNVLGLISRTTRDVDILALHDETTNKTVTPSLPDRFYQAAEVVGEEFELDEDWINTEPSAMVKTGLPEGLEQRLTFKEYGDRLTIGFIDRIDQIFFKCWASADQAGKGYRENRHVRDLEALEPTADEIEKAARWCMKQDPSNGFKTILIDMLEKLGFDHVAESI